jgi:hypothetical protein
MPTRRFEMGDAIQQKMHRADTPILNEVTVQPRSQQ